MDVDEMIRQLETALCGINTALGAFREIKRNMAPREMPAMAKEPPLPVVVLEEQLSSGRSTKSSRQRRGRQIRAAELETIGAP